MSHLVVNLDTFNKIHYLYLFIAFSAVAMSLLSMLYPALVLSIVALVMTCVSYVLAATFLFGMVLCYYDLLRLSPDEPTHIHRDVVISPEKQKEITVNFNADSDWVYDIEQSLEDKCFDIPEKFKCPITRFIMKNPVTCHGQTYEKTAIESWLSDSNHTCCPMTRKPVQMQDYKPNEELATEIKSWLAEKLPEHSICNQIRPAEPSNAALFGLSLFAGLEDEDSDLSAPLLDKSMQSFGKSL